MATKKERFDARDYEAAPEPTVTEPVLDTFVLVPAEEVKAGAPQISAEEQERRDLKARFKKVFGYKPTTKDLDELRMAVAEAEHRAQLKRDGII